MGDGDDVALGDAVPVGLCDGLALIVVVTVAVAHTVGDKLERVDND